MPTSPASMTFYSFRILSFLVSIFACIQFSIKVNLSEIPIKPSIKIAFHVMGAGVIIIGLTTVLISGNPFLSPLIDLLQLNTNALCMVFGGSRWLFVIVTRLVLILFYMQRLDCVFGNTVYAVTRGFKRGVWLVVFVGDGILLSSVFRLFVLGSMDGTFYFVKAPGMIGCLLRSNPAARLSVSVGITIWAMADVLMQIFLTVLFVWKVLAINSAARGSNCRILICNTTEDSNAVDRLLRMGARVCVLMTASSVFSVFSWVYLFQINRIILPDLDSTVNYTAAILMWHMFEGEYRILCCCFANACDKLMVHTSTAVAVQGQRNKRPTELHAIQSETLSVILERRKDSASLPSDGV